MRKREGFTLVELLVVIAVIALLMSILMPALKLARDQAMRIVCGARISQLTKGFIIYGTENKNRIPDDASGYGGWPWDVSFRTTNSLMDAMGIKTKNFNLSGDDDYPPQKVFYCPANIAQKRQRDSAWEFSVNVNDDSTYRVLGYIFLWADDWNGGGTREIMDKNGDVSTNKKWVDRMDMKNPAERELVVDAVMRDPGSDNFQQVLIGGMSGQGISDTTSHLKNPQEPLGGNIGFVDGHVEWRKFSDMALRFTMGPEWFY